jgi:hypothetical protein
LVNAEPKIIIDSVLNQIGVSRVISVDDKNKSLPDLSEILGHLQSLEILALEPLLAPFPGLFARDPEVLGQRVQAFWVAQNDESKRQFLEAIALGSGPAGAEVAADAAAVQALPVLFHSWDFQAMGLPQWRASATDIFKESESRKTMILFDEDLTDQGGTNTEGLTLIKEALSVTHEEQVVCCLLSHKYHMPTIQDEWRRVCEDNGFPEHRVIVIPKELLIDSPCDFAALVKLASVSKYYAVLKDKVQEIFVKSLAIASEKIRRLNLYDLDHMVFVSSDREGVWEPDTMIRLLGIFQRGETLTDAIRDASVRSASESIRKISGVSTPISTPPSGALQSILHLENYEDAGPLNELHRPTDLGDIYERDGGRQYILIVPQCDLMVRTKGGYRGTDSDTVKEGVLAEIVEREPKKGLGSKLEYYDLSRETFVDFKKASSVKLLCLDLCVFNPDGAARFKIDDPVPQLLIPAWTIRHKVIVKQLEDIIKTYIYIAPSGKQKSEISRHLTKANPDMTFWGTVDPEARSIVMNFKRVGRLLPPRSTALLKAYAEFLNRDAFEHSFI